MLSHNNGKFVEESVKSILSQTYRNWELLFVDDSSKDDTLSKLLDLKNNDQRINVSATVFENGPAKVMNSALKNAHGRWIAFINCGDIWAPEKLERQVSFMMKNNYSYSYTNYRMINEAGEDYGIVISGKKVVSFNDMIKCCWLCFPTVMYDANRVGHMQIKNLLECNDYALWLKVAEHTDCYLLNECLATQLAIRHLFSPFPIDNKLKWRYEVYHTEMGMNTIKSTLMTVRCLWYGIMKKIKYSKKIN
jgi:glycosyltransferase involved in cell wall biosynthesis